MLKTKLGFESKYFFKSPQLIFSVFTIIAARIITFIAFPEGSLLPDSGSYAPQKFLDFSLFSLSGNSMRGWPTPLLFALLPSNSVRIFTLLIISSIAWIYLAKTLILRSSSSSRSWLVSVLLLSVSCSPSLIQWDTTILGQSLLSSNVVFLVALIIKYFDNPNNFKIASGVLLTSMILSIQKSSNLFILIAAIVLVLSKSKKWTSHLWRSGISILIVIGTSYSIFVGVSVDNYWKGGTYSGKALLWHLGGQSPAAGDLKQYLANQSKAPSCIYESAPYANIDVEMSKIFQSCKDAEKYLSKSFKYDFTKFLISHPIDVAKLEAIGFGASFTNSSSNYGKTVAILPSSIYSLSQGSVSPDFRFSKSSDQVQAFNSLKNGEPIWVYAPGLFWLITAFSTFFVRLLLRERKLLDFGLVIPTIFLFVQTAITFLIIPSEWVRSTTAYVPLVILLSGVYLINNLFQGVKISSYVE